MESDFEKPNICTILDIFFSCIGIIFYIVSFILLKFYYKSPMLITEGIFTFIIAYSIKCLLQNILSFSLIFELLYYVIDCLLFYLVISFINKCFCSNKLSENSANFEISYNKIISITFCVCSFPLDKIFELAEKYFLTKYVLSLCLLILLYRYIHLRLQNLLDYLDDKKTTSSEIPDIYLPYMKAFYYYNVFSSINMIIFDALIIMASYFGVGIIYIMIKLNILIIIQSVFEKLSIISIIVCCLLMFYSFNQSTFGFGKNEEGGEGYNIAKFSVIDIDIQQDEKDNLNFSRKKNKSNKNKDINSQNDGNYTKITGEGEENKENDKDKEHTKVSEETESLK